MLFRYLYRKTKLLILACFVSTFFIGTSFADDPDPDSAEDFVKIASGGFRLTVDGNSPTLEPNPLGSGHNSYSWSMGWFNGELYVGTVRDVLCFAGATGPFFDPCPEGGIPGADQRAEIWKYTPDALLGVNGSWQRVYQSPLANSFLRFISGNPNLPRDVGYRTMSVCDAGDGIERLYVATEGVPGNILYSSNGSNFNPTSTNGLKASISNFLNGDFDIGYRGLVCFKGRLFTSPTGEQSGGSPDVSSNSVLLSNANPAQGGAWETVANFKTDAALGDSDNQSAFDMITLGDYLFVGVSNRISGFELWRGDGTNCQAPPGACNIQWEKIIDAGGSRPADGQDPVIDNALATFGVHNGKLYVGAWESGFTQASLAELLRVTPDTGEWELLVGLPRANYTEDPLLDNFTCSVDDAGTCYPATGRGPGFGDIVNPPDTSVGSAIYFWRFVSHGDHLYMGTFQFSQTAPGFSFYRTMDGLEWDTISTNGLGNPYNYGVRSLLSVDGLGLVVGTANPFTNAPDVPDTPPFYGGTEVFIGLGDPPPVDNTAPVSTITFPSNGVTYQEDPFVLGCDTPDVADICGTSTDDESGVSLVEVSIQRISDGMYWNGTDFSESSELFVSAMGTNDWVYNFEPQTSGDYKVHARGIDAAGNIEASPVVEFTYEAPEPEDNVVRISDLDASSNGYYPYLWSGEFTMSIVDENGAPVEEATVQFDLDDTEEECTTNASGKCSVSQFYSFVSSATLEITDIVDPNGAVYHPELNSDPDDDSDGTIIILNE